MLLDALEFLLDPVPRSAALNMAIDETLFATLRGPLLRIYQWRMPAVSFGYFVEAAPVLAAHPERDPVRRMTGGGVVLHGDDITYTLILPADHPIIRGDRVDSYRVIHEAVAAWLQSGGIPAALTPSHALRQSHECFANPVAHDLLVERRKIAGAAQRRTAHGLLHQGSVQFLSSPPPPVAELPGHFAKVVTPRLLDQEILDAAGNLAAEKYAAAAWLRRR